MKKYIRVDLRTADGIRKAERLQAKGGRVVQIGMDSVLVEVDK